MNGDPASDWRINPHVQSYVMATDQVRPVHVTYAQHEGSMVLPVREVAPSANRPCLADTSRTIHGSVRIKGTSPLADHSLNDRVAVS
jgi:hypothetical protein